MHAWTSTRSLGLIALATVLAGPVSAQDRSPPVLPRGWSVRHVRVEDTRRQRTASALPNHGLTIRRRFEAAPDTDDDPMFDGATHYNNIRMFDPFPTIDSGTQLPYGLDGIGGYGSDFGFGAAQDARVYDRGQ
jgi:hypothetical protein